MIVTETLFQQTSPEEFMLYCPRPTYTIYRFFQSIKIIWQWALYFYQGKCVVLTTMYSPTDCGCITYLWL